MEIREIDTIEGCQELEDLQMAVWGGGERTVMPDHLLITVQKNGGLLLGGYDEAGRMVGFVMGFVGLTKGGKLKHCSHMAGVLPELQNQNLGYRLKMAQRDFVLKQGLDLVTWTFDPLESRNARLNFHKLGVVCHTFMRNVYGEMADELNAGLPSDRFQVDWHLKAPWVVGRAMGSWSGNRLASLLRGETAVYSPLTYTGHLPSASRFLVEIPASFQAVKQRDMGLARQWRSQFRLMFEDLFAAGYYATDLLFAGEESFYLLEKKEGRLGD